MSLPLISSSSSSSSDGSGGLHEIRDGQQEVKGVNVGERGESRRWSGQMPDLGLSRVAAEESR
jgi:hypothetical protein